jgi:hypothetical protein
MPFKCGIKMLKNSYKALKTVDIPNQSLKKLMNVKKRLKKLRERFGFITKSFLKMQHSR